MPSRRPIIPKVRHCTRARVAKQSKTQIPPWWESRREWRILLPFVRSLCILLALVGALTVTRLPCFNSFPRGTVHYRSHPVISLRWWFTDLQTRSSMPRRTESLACAVSWRESNAVSWVRNRGPILLRLLRIKGTMLTLRTRNKQGRPRPDRTSILAKFIPSRSRHGGCGVARHYCRTLDWFLSPGTEMFHFSGF